MENKLVQTRSDISNLANRISRATRVGLDSESTGPGLVKGKMINVARSFMSGFSIAFDDGNAYYIPVGHYTNNVPIGLTKPIFEALGKVDRVWAHNWKHDLQVLEKEGLFLPQKVLHDSMILYWMAASPSKAGKYGLKDLAKDYLDVTPPSFEDTVGKAQMFGALDPKNKQALEYACHDARNTLNLALKVRNLPQNFDLEMYFMRVLYDMERAGMGLNVKGMETTYIRCQEQCEEILSSWDALFPGVSISSAKQLRDALINTPELGYKHRWSKKFDKIVGCKNDGRIWDPTGLPLTPGGQVSTNREAIEIIHSRAKKGSVSRRAADLKLAYQDLQKVMSTFTRSLVDQAMQYPDGRLHPSYKQTGTATGRLSCSSPNLQQLPRASKDNPLVEEVKRNIVPREGYKLVSADYSQIELRVLAHMCGDGALWEAYSTGKDIHQQTAELVGCTRQQGKTINFASVYGAGPEKMGKLCETTPANGKKFLEKYYEAYPEVADLKERVVHEARTNGGIKTLLGRFRPIPELSWGGSEQWKGERLAFNTPIQGGAADIVKIAMIKMHKQLSSNHYMVAQVHDDLVFEIPEKDVDDFQHVLQNTMESAYKLSVPLVAEPASGSNWLECK